MTMIHRKKSSKGPYIFFLILVAVAGIYFAKYGGDDDKKSTDEKQEVATTEVGDNKPAGTDDKSATVKNDDISLDVELPDATPNNPVSQNVKNTGAKPKQGADKVTSELDRRIQGETAQEQAFNAYNQFVEAKPPVFAKYAQTRTLLQTALKLTNSAEVREQIVQKLDKVNEYLIYSNKVTPGFVAYQIKVGDTLGKIGKQHGVYHGFIQHVNGIANAAHIRAGQRIKIPTAPIRIEINKSAYQLMVFMGDALVKVYNVGLGKNDGTPEGEFMIITKLVDPVWYWDGEEIAASDPRNELGTRWLGFDIKGYGIHGTRQPDTIGKSVSRGCIRLTNGDVEKLFKLIPRKTAVKIY